MGHVSVLQKHLSHAAETRGRARADAGPVPGVWQCGGAASVTVRLLRLLCRVQ